VPSASNGGKIVADSRRRDGGTMNDFIAHLPQAELHVHLEGRLEPGLSFELAREGA
jgi:hypothetical protein